MTLAWPERLIAVEAERDEWIAKEQEVARLEYIGALEKAEAEREQERGRADSALAALRELVEAIDCAPKTILASPCLDAARQVLAANSSANRV